MLKSSRGSTVCIMSLSVRTLSDLGYLYLKEFYWGHTDCDVKTIETTKANALVDLLRE